MDDSEHSSRTATANRKRPYETPRVQESAYFETLALACAKLPGDGNCLLGGTTNS